MSSKPFKIAQPPPSPPTTDSLAHKHRLSKKETAAIKQFASSVASVEITIAAKGARPQRAPKTARKK